MALTKKSTTVCSRAYGHGWPNDLKINDDDDDDLADYAWLQGYDDLYNVDTQSC